MFKIILLIGMILISHIPVPPLESFEGPIFEFAGYYGDIFYLEQKKGEMFPYVVRSEKSDIIVYNVTLLEGLDIISKLSFVDTGQFNGEGLEPLEYSKGLLFFYREELNKISN